MNCSRLLVTTIVGGSLFFGSPVAELALEHKENHTVATLPRDFNEHLLNDSRPNHMQIMTTSMSSTASKVSTLRFPQGGWAVAS